ncbi:MAG: helicase HerA-like domain-containing protein [Thermomicrobiales bacterium]
MTEPLLIAKSGNLDLVLLPELANRHGVVTGATGTGKTVTIQSMIEKFSEAGVPVFVADIKGDVAGLAAPGGGNDKVDQRLADLGLPPLDPVASPVIFWDVYGELGHPVRTTVSEMGPLLLARLLDLNDTQTGVLLVGFAWADDQQLPLVDLSDLRALLNAIGERRKELSSAYGAVSTASIGAIQRGLLRLEEAGGDQLFGEPALDLNDFIRLTPEGRGYVNVLAAERLFHQPLAYGTFLLWMLSELFENLPEVGDPEKPALVFFFDEAHLLFDDMPKKLSDRIQQVVRLIRSKGVGVYFITQMPIDIPDVVLGQLGNRVQHALRAYTPRDQKAIRAVAETFRVNESFDIEDAITQLVVGEALISFLDPKGAPNVVERGLVIPPRSRIGPISTEERAAVMNASPFVAKYADAVDRESASEILLERLNRAEAQGEAERQRQEFEEERAALEKEREKLEREAARRTSRSRSTKDPLDEFLGDTASTLGRELGRALSRGILGSLRR